MEKRSRRLSLNSGAQQIDGLLLNLINGAKININTLQINAKFWNSRLFLEASTSFTSGLTLGRKRKFIPQREGGGGVVDGTPSQSFW